jgi:hypothetical protein
MFISCISQSNSNNSIECYISPVTEIYPICNIMLRFANFLKPGEAFQNSWHQEADIKHVSRSGSTDIRRQRTKMQSLQQSGVRDLCTPDIKYNL